jgi:RNA polymerase sigma factor (sigma-70 family)
MALYRDRVFNTAISMVQDSAAAEDITQEVFVTVFRSMLSFNERSSIGTWLYRITVNKCLDHRRAQQRAKRGGLFGIISLGMNDAETTAPFDHPGVRLEQREYARHLFAAIDALPENQRTAFILAHIEELPQKEIADIMDMSVKAVESLLQRAKGALRKKLSGIYEGFSKR